MKKLISTIALLLGVKGAFAQGSVSLMVNQQACNNDGIVTATFTGMIPPIYVYWNNQTDTITGNTDTYTHFNGYGGCFAEDGYGNFASNTIYAPLITASATAGIVTCPATTALVQLNISGGTPPYTEIWDHWANPVIISYNGVPYNYSYTNVNPNDTVITTGTNVSLPPGSYYYRVVDANGCVNVFNNYSNWNDTFNVFTSPGFTYNFTAVNPACPIPGSAAITGINGGLAPYSYSWSNGTTSSAIGNLATGGYAYTVTDAQGCADSNTFYLVDQNPIQVNAVTTDATCLQNDGSITAFASGGTAPYTFSTPGGFPTYNGGTSSGVPGGNYDVTATDANGCVNTTYAYVNTGTPIYATVATIPSSCTASTGSATLTIAGGQAPYTVTWDTSPAIAGTSISNMPAGTYHFHIVDANGCIQDGAAQIDPEHVLYFEVAATNAICPATTGTAWVYSQSGGTLPYTYSWSNISLTDSSVALSGYHTVTVTDAIGCSKTKPVSVQQVSPVQVGFVSTPASCVYNADGTVLTNITGGTAPYTTQWSNGQSSTTLSGVSTGSYYLYGSDANGCAANGYTYVGYDPANSSCYCTITGTVYNDANSNCQQDAGEPGITGIGINCGGFGYTWTNNSGNYSFIVPSGTYTLSEVTLPHYPLAACQGNNISVTTVAATGCTQTVNFADSLIPVHDVRVATWNYNQPRPGFSYSQWHIISNDGTVAETDVTSAYNTDAQIGTASFMPSGIFSGSGTQYGAAGMAIGAGQYQQYLASYNVPANVPLGTALTFKDTASYQSPLSDWLADHTPWNNVKQYTATTVGSFDPNFIEVSPQGAGTAGNILAKDSILEYMVHFQNTGSYYAQNIVVTDTLDADLDWTTLRPGAGSAPFTTTMTPQGVASFTFTNINLPTYNAYSNSSNGMFSYTIKPKHGLALGTQFTNKASIYFDFNVPVATNTVLNTLYDGTGTGSAPAIQGPALSVYPNPAGSQFSAAITVTVAGEATLKITDITGKDLRHQTLQLHTGSQIVTVNTANMIAGVYFVSLSQNGSTSTQQLTVIK